MPALCDATSDHAAADTDITMRKKPAAAITDITIKRKPAAAGAAVSPLTTTNVDQKKNSDMAAQNEQLSKCLTAAQFMLQKQDMANKRALTAEVTNEVIPETENRMKNIHIEELTSLTSDIENAIQDVKDASIHKQHLAFSNSKIDILDKAHNLINESKDVIKGLLGLMKGRHSHR